jgi:hypothetical protein
MLRFTPRSAVRRIATFAKSRVHSLKNSNPGPYLPFIAGANAAMQLRQTGHSSITQHLRSVKDDNADKSSLRCAPNE